jgi:anaerobic selenocysteine-containing dehydrogenase
MKDRISRREFAKTLVRVSLLAGLGYSVFRAVCKNDSEKGNAQCKYPEQDCSGCAISNQCRNTSRNFGKDM